MNKFLKISLLLFIYCFFSSLVIGKDIFYLKGDLSDCLIDLQKQTYFLNNQKRNLPTKLTSNYYFFFNSELFSYNKGVLTNLNTNHQTTILQSHNIDILPFPNKPTSIQSFLSNGVLFVPCTNSVIAFNITSNKSTSLSLPKLTSVNNDLIQFPKFFYISNSYFFYQANKLNEFKEDKWEIIKKIKTNSSLETSTLELDNQIAILNSCVTRGDLDSFRVELGLINTKTNKYSFFKLNGILRKAGSDKKNTIIISYKKVSIFSELFGKNKVHFQVIQLKNNTKQIKKYSFKISHKRNHIFFFIDNEKKLNALVQCKDGTLYVFNSKTGQFKKRKNIFNYNYNFIRGRNGGYFIDQKNNTYSIVNFTNNSN